MKRLFDIVFSLTGLILVFPFMIPVMIILRLTGEHYIFYSQDRVGRHGRMFKMIKFSTMLRNSPELLTGDVTLRNDPRVFKFGRFLRLTKINEIPQLLNVLIGNMSVVGPRPMPPANFNFYTEEAKAMVLKLKPGMTGVGTIIFREEEEILAASPLSPGDTHRKWISPHKARLEEWYLTHQSLWTDIKIIFLTFWVIPFKNSTMPYRVLKGLPKFPEELKFVTRDYKTERPRDRETERPRDQETKRLKTKTHNHHNHHNHHNTHNHHNLQRDYSKQIPLQPPLHPEQHPLPRDHFFLCGEGAGARGNRKGPGGAEFCPVFRVGGCIGHSYLWHSRSG